MAIDTIERVRLSITGMTPTNLIACYSKLETPAPPTDRALTT